MTSPMRPVTDARLMRPLRDFLHTEAAGGVVLLGAALAAMVWANSPVSDSYRDLWSSTVTIGFRDHVLTLDLRTWVNDALMSVFFFAVGVEIKRELVVGELRDRKTAALPVVAAVGGMALPAVIFLAFNAGGIGGRGWGIPMATDIAMAVGVLSLLGSRVEPSLKLFLLALAIVDDIGAIVVIALFYSASIHPVALGVGALLVAVVLALRAVGIRAIWPYVAVGAGLWLAIHESGVHATITGVVLGLLTPARARWSQETVDRTRLADVSTVPTARETRSLARESVSVAEWLEHVIHPWSSFVIVPLFALANAGVVLSSDSIGDALTSPITHGVVAGLVVGKLFGVAAFAWLACRLRLASLPRDTTWSGIVGVAGIAGIGFTVSIFVSGLAFGTDARVVDAKLGVLAASLLAAALGSILLARRGPTDRRPPPGS